MSHRCLCLLSCRPCLENIGLLLLQVHLISQFRVGLASGLPDPGPGIPAFLHDLTDVAKTSAGQVTGFLVTDQRKEDVLLLAGVKVNAVELIDNGFDLLSEVSFDIDGEMLVKFCGHFFGGGALGFEFG